MLGKKIIQDKGGQLGEIKFIFFSPPRGSALGCVYTSTGKLA